MHSSQRSKSSWPIKGLTRTATLTRLLRIMSPPGLAGPVPPLPPGSGGLVGARMASVCVCVRSLVSASASMGGANTESQGLASSLARCSLCLVLSGEEGRRGEYVAAVAWAGAGERGKKRPWEKKSIRGAKASIAGIYRAAKPSRHLQGGGLSFPGHGASEGGGSTRRVERGADEATLSPPKRSIQFVFKHTRQLALSRSGASSPRPRRHTKQGPPPTVLDPRTKVDILVKCVQRLPGRTRHPGPLLCPCCPSIPSTRGDGVTVFGGPKPVVLALPGLPKHPGTSLDTVSRA